MKYEHGVTSHKVMWTSCESHMTRRLTNGSEGHGVESVKSRDTLGRLKFTHV